VTCIPLTATSFRVATHLTRSHYVRDVILASLSASLRLDFGVSPNYASKFESDDQDGGAVVPNAVGMVSG